MEPLSIHVDPPLRTARLTLRTWTPPDEPLFAELFADPLTNRYLYSAPMTAAEVADRFAPRLLAPVADEDGTAIRLAVEVTATRTFVGEVVLSLPSVAHRQAEIGYIFSPGARGCGYATEAAEAVVDVAFEAGAHRVVARADGRNTASVAVMRRLGMRYEALLVQNEWVKGEWTDEIVHAVLASEWATRPAPIPG